jgi:hypothetical protein
LATGVGTQSHFSKLKKRDADAALQVLYLGMKAMMPASSSDRSAGQLPFGKGGNTEGRSEPSVKYKMLIPYQINGFISDNHSSTVHILDSMHNK